MANYLGSLSWGIVPLYGNTSNLATMSWDYRNNYLKSANDQLRYQVQWMKSGLNEGVEPSAGNYINGEGDIVNAIFKIETSVDGVNWTTIGTIKKSRDIANRRYETGTAPSGHRFTIDISQLVSDQLSYSLCPINKGTWQSPFYGGMNGGAVMQDNVIGALSASGNPISNYNVSENGAFRRVKVSATFDIINGDGEIADGGFTLSNPSIIAVINSVNQFERDNVDYYTQFLHDQNPPSLSRSKRFLTRCPNWYYDNTENKVAYHKSVRMDEQAEFLQWYVFFTYDGASPTQYLNYYELFGVAYDYDGTETEFVLADFNSLLSTAGTGNPATEFAQSQKRMLIQNVSPDFINNNAFVPQTGAGRPYLTSISPITSTIEKYSLNARGRYYDDTLTPPAYVNKTLSATNWYKIDRENENIPYGFVRFHWLNSMGGIDSYTAKRDIVEGLTMSKGVVERNSADRTWYQANSYSVNGSETNISDSSYISDTMRGGNLYKGGREVSSVNADRVQSVYTEPLNKSVATWLEEILLSPNVWIEKDTDATKKGNTGNPYLRPSTKGYIPVIITNSDAETVNQENGLVRFNIEYTLSHKVQTQRN